MVGGRGLKLAPLTIPVMKSVSDHQWSTEGSHFLKPEAKHSLVEEYREE